MAIFHSTGKDENLQMLSSEFLALGGQPGKSFYNFTYFTYFKSVKINSKQAGAELCQALVQLS